MSSAPFLRTVWPSGAANLQYNAVASGSADLTAALLPELMTLGSCPIPEATLPQRWTSRAGVPGALLQSCKAGQDTAPSPVLRRSTPSDIIVYGQPIPLPKALERHRRLTTINIDDLPPTSAVLTSIAVAAIIHLLRKVIIERMQRRAQLEGRKDVHRPARHGSQCESRKSRKAKWIGRGRAAQEPTVSMPLSLPSSRMPGVY